MESLNQTINPIALSASQAPAPAPVELVVDILYRLPVKSLLRFRCLSKFFQSTIDGPDFINRHLKRSIEMNSNLSLILSGFRDSYSRMFTASLDAADNCVEVDHPFKNCRYRRMCDTLVSGSCNGLLVVHNDRKGIMLLNPSTKKYKMVPMSIKDLINCDAYYDGFGYDVATDDYKLVTMKEHSELTVYSLNSNSSRRIENFPCNLTVLGGPAAFVQGALHWLAMRNLWSDEEELIIAFDLKTEVLSEMQLPHIRDDNISIDVDVLGGCLSLICMHLGGQPCDVWLMKEYGVNDSWTKLFSFKEGVIGKVHSVKALAYSKNGDQVLVNINEGDLRWCNLKEQSLSTSVEIHGVPVDYDCVDICVDSLVSPDAYRG